MGLGFSFFFSQGLGCTVSGFQGLFGMPDDDDDVDDDDDDDDDAAAADDDAAAAEHDDDGGDDDDVFSLVTSGSAHLDSSKRQQASP